MGQVQKDRQSTRNEPPTPDADPTTGKVEQARSVSNDTDDLLDAIDDILEENAEEFVQQYKQQNGQ